MWAILPVMLSMVDGWKSGDRWRDTSRGTLWSERGAVVGGQCSRAFECLWQLRLCRRQRFSCKEKIHIYLYFWKKDLWKFADNRSRTSKGASSQSKTRGNVSEPSILSRDVTPTFWLLLIRLAVLSHSPSSSLYIFRSLCLCVLRARQNQAYRASTRADRAAYNVGTTAHIDDVA